MRGGFGVAVDVATEGGLASLAHRDEQRAALLHVLLHRAELRSRRRRAPISAHTRAACGQEREPILPHERTSAPVNMSLGPAMTQTCASISRSRVIASLLLRGRWWDV